METDVCYRWLDGRLIWCIQLNSLIIRRWDVVKVVLVAELNGHTGPVVSVRTSPSDNWLLTCAKDGCVKIWDEDKHVVVGETVSVRLSSQNETRITDGDGAGDDRAVSCW
jgi:WD40 repeat protein